MDRALNRLPVRHFSPGAIARLAAGLALALVYVVPQQAQSSAQSGLPCAVSGFVQAGSQPLPGVAIVALGADGAEVSATSSEQNGSYVLRFAAPGTYQIKASLAAFAPASREATLGAGDCTARVDVTLTLASRAAAAPGATATTPRPASPPAQAPSTGSGQAAGRGRGGAGRGGFQQLDVVTNATGEQSAAASSNDEATATLRAELQLPPGFSADAPTETVATAGIQGQSNEALLFGGRGGGRGEFGEGGPEGFGRGGEGGFGGGGEQGGLAAVAALALAAGAAAARAGLAVPAGSAACVAADVSRATPTTRSAARRSTPHLIRSTAVCVRSPTTCSSATAPRSAVR